MSNTIYYFNFLFLLGISQVYKMAAFQKKANRCVYGQILKESPLNVTYFFPPTFNMTGPDIILSAMMRNGDGGLSLSEYLTNSSLLTGSSSYKS